MHDQVPIGLQARLRSGTCAGCGALTSLPGLDATGQPTCSRCSGIPARFRCGCGREVTAGERGRCWWCVLSELVTDVLADPGGEVPAHLRPLADGLVSMRRPQSGVVWLRRSTTAREALRDLAHGRIPRSHAALDALGADRAVECLRCLLVRYRVLPPRDRRLADFQRWAAAKLDATDNDEHRQLLERFLRWRLLRHLRSGSTTETPVGHGPYQRAKQRLTTAAAFLAWLADRDRQLGECTQHDLDEWLLPGPPPGGTSSPSCPGPASSASSGTSKFRYSTPKGRRPARQDMTPGSRRSGGCCWMRLSRSATASPAALSCFTASRPARSSHCAPPKYPAPAAEPGSSSAPTGSTRPSPLPPCCASTYAVAAVWPRQPTRPRRGYSPAARRRTSQLPPAHQRASPTWHPGPGEPPGRMARAHLRSTTRSPLRGAGRLAGHSHAPRVPQRRRLVGLRRSPACSHLERRDVSLGCGGRLRCCGTLIGGQKAEGALRGRSEKVGGCLKTAYPGGGPDGPGRRI
jgi:hypothetical protein